MTLCSLRRVAPAHPPGIMSVAITPNVQVAGIISGTFYFNWTLFCGFIIPKPNIPGWWVLAALLVRETGNKGFPNLMQQPTRWTKA